MVNASSAFTRRYQPKQTVRLPIAKAKELMLERGFPVRGSATEPAPAADAAAKKKTGK